MKITVSELAERIGAELIGSGEVVIESVGAVALAGANDITFIAESKYSAAVRESGAGAVMLCEAIEGLHVHHIKSFDKFPELRTELENGITLCGDCHYEIHYNLSR